MDTAGRSHWSHSTTTIGSVPSAHMKPSHKPHRQHHSRQGGQHNKIYLPGNLESQTRPRRRKDSHARSNMKKIMIVLSTWMLIVLVAGLIGFFALELAYLTRQHTLTEAWFSLSEAKTAAFLSGVLGGLVLGLPIILPVYQYLYNHRKNEWWWSGAMWSCFVIPPIPCVVLGVVMLQNHPVYAEFLMPVQVAAQFSSLIAFTLAMGSGGFLLTAFVIHTVFGKT